MILYVSMMGLTEPLGRSQVLSYVLGLARRGQRMALLSFEKPSAEPALQAEVARSLEEHGVRWLRRRLHQPATSRSMLLDLASLGQAIGAECLRGEVRLVHARSYVAAMGAELAERTLGVPFLFDIRGFWPDERIESGAWRPGLKHRALKRVERTLYARAAGIVTLTARALPELPTLGAHGQPAVVIPTCVDLAAYAGLAERPRGAGPVLGYLGSFGGRYLIDETVAVFAAVRALAPAARLEVLTPSDPAPLWAACAAHGVPSAAVSLGQVPPAAVPARLAGMDATFSLIKPGFASLASCPTKFGESLAAGCPVVCNPGIGDCADISAEHRVGVVHGLEPARRAQVAAELLGLLAEGAALRRRAYQTAASLFSLELGVERYAQLYRRLLAGPSTRSSGTGTG